MSNTSTQNNTQNSTQNRVALITGANKGLGLEIARQLGKEGFTVVITSRNLEAGAKAKASLTDAGIQADLVALEVTNQDDIKKAAIYLAEKYGKLDVLVNNAGISLDWDGTPMSAEKLHKTFDVNVVAPWAITEALIPLLAKSNDARVINHSSILGSIQIADKNWQQMNGFFTEAYSTSKAALNMLTVIQSHKFEDKKIAVASAHPGWVKTDLGGEGAPLELVDGAKTVVGLATMPREKFPHATMSHMGEQLPW